MAIYQADFKSYRQSYIYEQGQNKIIDIDNEKITGKRTEGSIYGTFNLSRRIGQTIATSGAMFLLAIIKYDGELTVQSDFTKMGLKILCVLLPGIFVLGSWAAFKFIWKMNKVEVNESIEQVI